MLRHTHCTLTAAAFVLLASTARADDTPPSAATAPETARRGHTGWANTNAGIGLTLAAAGLGQAVAADVIQSDGEDGRVLGASAIGTFCVGELLVGLSRSSTNGRGSLGLRITGHALFAASLIAGVALFVDSMSTGETYPTGVVSGLGVAGATAMSILSAEALMARSDASRGEVSAKASAPPPTPPPFVPVVSAVAGRHGEIGGGMVGIARAF